MSIVFFFFKQKTAYEMRISDWSSDVCSSDLPKDQRDHEHGTAGSSTSGRRSRSARDCQTVEKCVRQDLSLCDRHRTGRTRSEEHTSELQSLMRNSYAVFCLKKKTPQKQLSRNNRIRYYTTHHKYNSTTINDN